jgi:PleD family two-component response regulator
MRVTLSLGVAVLEGAEAGAARALAMADRALYAAKAQGRNRVRAEPA